MLSEILSELQLLRNLVMRKASGGGASSPFTPAVPAAWAGRAPPTTIAEALNRIQGIADIRGSNTGVANLGTPTVAIAGSTVRPFPGVPGIDDTTPGQFRVDGQLSIQTTPGDEVTFHLLQNGPDIPDPPTVTADANGFACVTLFAYTSTPGIITWTIEAHNVAGHNITAASGRITWQQVFTQ